MLVSLKIWVNSRDLFNLPYSNNTNIYYLDCASSGTLTFNINNVSGNPGIRNQADGPNTIGTNSGNDKWIVGSISEIIIYNRILTSSEKIDINKYLTTKYKTLRILLRAINYSGSGYWPDESSYGNNADLLTGTIAKNSASNGIVLDGSTTWTFPNVGVQNSWTANVWYKDNGSLQGSCILTQQFTGTNFNVCLTNAFTNTIQSGFYASGWNVSSGYTLTQNIWTNIQVTWNGKKIKVYINGVLYSTTEKSATAIDSGRLYFISHKWDNADHMIGEIGEVRIYNYVLSESEIISDYQSSVSTFIWQPTSINGCQLWFDGLDLTSIVLSDSTVTQWSDKSGLDKNTTTVTGTPTFTAGSGIVFDGSSYFTLPDESIPYGNSSYSIYVVTTINNSGNFAGFIGSGASDNNQCLNIRLQADGTINTYWFYNDLQTSTTVNTGTRFLYNSLYQSGANRTVFLFGSPVGSDTPVSRNQPNTGNTLGKTTDVLLCLVRFQKF